MVPLSFLFLMTGSQELNTDLLVTEGAPGFPEICSPGFPFSPLGDLTSYVATHAG